MCKKIFVFLMVMLMLAGCSPSENKTVSTVIPVSETPLVTTPLPVTTIPPHVLEIPYGNEPVLDGLFSSGEWGQALHQEFTDGGKLLLMQDGKYLYLGIEQHYLRLAFATICLAHGSEVSIFHTSEYLGTAVFQQDAADWVLTRPFEFQLFEVTGHAPEDEQLRQKFFEENAWLSNLGDMSGTEQIEYKITIPDEPFSIAVAYPLPGYASAPSAVWPADLSDDCRLPSLLQGDSGQNASEPLRLKFAPETWGTLNFAPATADLPTQPVPSSMVQEQGTLAFSSDMDGDFEIWLSNPDGTEQRPLTDNDDMDISPAWSPDGTQIVFVSDRDGNEDVYGMNADGSDVRRLTNTPDASESFPTWSPDGKYITFDSNRENNWDIYMMAMDGTDVQRLTDNPDEDWISSWSPDGQQIVFESKRDGNYEIYIMNRDGSNQQRLTQNTVQDGAPKWSPDGSYILFFSRRDGNMEIYRMNPDGRDVKRLTDQKSNETFPAWSPDGLKIIFVSEQNNHSEIWMMDENGNNPKPVIHHEAQNWTPVWGK